MRFIRISSEDEMIALYLHEELTGRFESNVSAILERERIDRSIIDTPDLAVASGNDLRRHLLGLYRGYGVASDDGYLAGFPHTDVRWEWHALAPDELWKIRYVRIAYWLELSGGSLLPRDAARRIRLGMRSLGISNGHLLSVEAAVRSGVRLPPMILAASPIRQEMLIVEGHARLTGYALADDQVEQELEVLIGFSPRVGEWRLS